MIWMVMQHDWPNAVNALIERGCDVNAVDYQGTYNGVRTGYTAMHSHSFTTATKPRAS